MLFESKKVSLITLGITAVIGSRVLFSLFDDPEGPNLLIVVVTAAVIYLVSLPVYKLNSLHNAQKFYLAIGVQVVAVTILYVLGVTF